ncbi:MAG TPA: erythromycin esterase family protein [Gemmatimonadaceae bacterium]|nr:erythromycin esterase family protein [Gemmatimonadaceae bacterium]
MSLTITTSPADAGAARTVAANVRPLVGAPSDFDALLDLVGDARYVLIGEASHGTHEFYRVRAEITKRLITACGFAGVAVEADWPDAYRVNRFVRGLSDDADATDALGGFVRFPQWMWRNADVLDFVGWLRSYNDAVQTDDAKVGFYGLDLYSLHASMAAVLAYLDSVDPEAAARARERYACFDAFGPDPQTYGYAASLGLAPSCEAAVIGQLVELQRSAAEYARRDGRIARDALFFAEQNARLVQNAERYYRAMFLGSEISWNVRDRHMTETLESLAFFLDLHGKRLPTAPAKLVVWAHNSHLGDARATEMARRGEVNVGHLVRVRNPISTKLVGFTTYTGTVTAASDWGKAAERKAVRPALDGSYEALFHEIGFRRFLLDLTQDSEARRVLMSPRLERAIGVIYRPETERLSHYFHAVLPGQFDAVLHYDTTRAVEPLERSGIWERGELPETHPTAL